MLLYTNNLMVSVLNIVKRCSTMLISVSISRRKLYYYYYYRYIELKLEEFPIMMLSRQKIRVRLEQL